MDTEVILSYAVTLLGFLLCAFSALFILRGKPIAGDRGTAQILRFKGLEVQTNGVIALLLVSALVAVLPLALMYWHSASPPPQVVKTTPKLFITGRVEDESGRGLAGAKVTLFRSDGQNEVKVDGDGAFDFSISLKEGEDKVKLSTEKPGYRPQHLIMGFNWLNYPAVLVKEGL